MKIPMVDLGIQYRKLKDEIDAAISEVLATTRFILGLQGQMLEEADIVSAIYYPVPLHRQEVFAR